VRQNGLSICETLRLATRELMGFASFDPSHALSFLMLAPLFIWFALDMTRKELAYFVGEKVG
jgi:hypothetical protein